MYKPEGLQLDQEGVKGTPVAFPYVLIVDKSGRGDATSGCRMVRDTRKESVRGHVDT